MRPPLRLVALAALIGAVLLPGGAAAQTSGVCYSSPPGHGDARCAGAAGQVMATPSGAAGPAVLRSLTPADIPVGMGALEITMGGPMPLLNSSLFNGTVAIGMQTVAVGGCFIGCSYPQQDVYKLGAARTVSSIAVSCYNTAAGTPTLDVSLLCDSAGGMAPTTVITTITVACGGGAGGSGFASFGPVVLAARSTCRYGVIVSSGILFGPGFVSASVR